MAVKKNSKSAKKHKPKKNTERAAKTKNNKKEIAKETASVSNVSNILYIAIIGILAILVILSFVNKGFDVPNKISSDEAGDKAKILIDRLLQGQATSEIISVEEKNALYEITYKINGQEQSKVYMTLDGEKFFPQTIPTNTTIKEPTLDEQYPRKNISMEELADDDAYLGNKDAPVTVVVFSDYQCPFCGASEGTNEDLINRFRASDPTWEPAIPKIREKYIDNGKVKFVFRDFPLKSIHPYAEKAAEAAECAGEQGKYWEMHDKLFEEGVEGGVDTYKQYASDIGLDRNLFDECIDSGKMEAEVNKDLADGSSLGVRGTPAFFVNGRLMSGALPFSEIEKVIEAELKNE